jgi:hypothetical protein
MKALIQKVRDEVYNLFPADANSKSAMYRCRDWIFPNHFDIMLDLAKDLCVKYNGDFDICSLAILLHDTGLVYKRDTDSPLGHEERSLEFTKLTLSKFGADDALIDSVVACVVATDVSVEAVDVNQKIVRTVDAMSQYISVHFFAKAHFYEKWSIFIEFLQEKSGKGFNKICFEDERKQIEPIVAHMKQALFYYNKYNYLK